MPKLFTQEEKDYFVEHIHADGEEGKLTWKKSRNKFTEWMIGKEIGSVNSKGYLTFTVTGFKGGFLVHRVLYWMLTGEEYELDHKDRVKTNNKLINLRPATSAQNNANSAKRKGNKHSPGISKTSSGLYRAQIFYKGHREELGLYSNAEDATAAYKKRHQELHGEYSMYHGEDVDTVEAIQKEEKVLNELTDKDIYTLCRRYEVVNGRLYRWLPNKLGSEVTRHCSINGKIFYKEQLISKWSPFKYN